MKKFICILLLSSINISTVQAGTTEVGTEFTYQGELLDNGSPADGVYDLLIQLYATETGGSPIDFVSFEDITITNGLINTVLDYGDLPFNGDESYLQINIRPGASTGNLTPLNPRQRINVTPYAIQSAFVENVDASPWVDVTGGINYSQDVFIGNSNTVSDSLLTVDTAANESPLRLKINGATRLIVRDNGGTSVGANGAAPENGLRVQGDANQALLSHGFVKAGVLIDCGAGINGSSIRYFNTVNGSDFTTNQNGAAGGCSLTVPFDISDAFIAVSAHASGGIDPFETTVGSCSTFSSTQLNCQLHNISGGNTSLANGVLQVLIY